MSELDRKRAMVELVDQILAAKRCDPLADVSVLEAEIDSLISRLHDQAPKKAEAPELREALAIHAR